MGTSKLMRAAKYALRFLPDRAYIQLYYFSKFKKFCNFRNPVTYNEKLQWLKLNDRNPAYPMLVDKYEAKKHVAKIIGEEYIIPTLGVWNSFDEIDFDALPDRFVLKCTHDSEGVVIVRDKKNMDMAAVRGKLSHALGQNFYYVGREWPYKNLKPRIIAEQYIENSDGSELQDYKFMCFGGEPKALYIISARKGLGMSKDFFDIEFGHLDVLQERPNAKVRPEKPASYPQMLELTKKLAKGFPHVRVDLYDVDGRIYFGELTFYPASGFKSFQPDKWDKIFGDMLKLPE